MKKFLIGLIGMVMGCGVFAAAGNSDKSGITDHGVASPVSNLGGVVSTANKAGQDLVVAFLADASGGAGALVVNIDTRKCHFTPFPGHKWNIDARAFTSLLSRANRYYTAFGDRFYEFDPETMTFTFAADIDGYLGMGMCEDANGVVYVNSYPKGNITAFDPKTRTIREYGSPKKVNYAVYCRYMACDDDGWIYCGNGSTEAEIQAFGNIPTRTKSHKDMIADIMNKKAFDVRSTPQNIDFSPGDIVSHRKFGRGMVLSVTPSGGDVRIEIAFDTVGTKSLMGAFAKLKKENS